MTTITGILPLDALGGLHSFYVLLRREGEDSRLLAVKTPDDRQAVVLYSSREAGDEAADALQAPLKMMSSNEAVRQFMAIAQVHGIACAWLNPALETLIEFNPTLIKEGPWLGSR